MSSRLVRRLGLDPERGEDVGGARQGAAPSLSSAFVPARQGGRDLARHREHLAPLLEREIRRDQSAAALACLDDDGRRAQPGHDAVARGEAPGRRLDAGRVLRDDEACVGDATRELGVRGRIVAVDAAAEDGDGRPVRLERPAMRLGVDAARQPAHDDKPGSRELPAQAAGDRGAVPRACARADDRNRRLGQKLGLRQAAEEESRRRIVDRSEERWEVRRRSRHEAVSRRSEPLEIGALVEAPLERPPPLAARRADQVRARLRGEDRERELRHSRARPASDRRAPPPRARLAPSLTPASAAIVRATRPTRA